MRSMKIPKALHKELYKNLDKIAEYHMEPDYFGEPGQGDYSIWITLKEGWINPHMGTRTIHSASAKDAIQELRDIEPDPEDEDEETESIKHELMSVLNDIGHMIDEHIKNIKNTVERDRKRGVKLTGLGIGHDKVAMFMVKNPHSDNQQKIIEERPVMHSIDGRKCMVFESEQELKLVLEESEYKGELMSIGAVFDNAIPMDEFEFRMKNPEINK